MESFLGLLGVALGTQVGTFFFEAFKRIIPKISLKVDIEFQPERVPAAPGRQLRFVITALHSFLGLGIEFS